MTVLVFGSFFHGRKTFSKHYLVKSLDISFEMLSLSSGHCKYVIAFPGPSVGLCHLKFSAICCMKCNFDSITKHIVAFRAFLFSERIRNEGLDTVFF